MVRKFLQSACRWLASGLALVLICAGTPVFAQAAYPNKPIRLIVPFTPGGVTDTSGRLIADQLSRRIGQQVIVENKSGAGGNIGADIRGLGGRGDLLATICGDVDEPLIAMQSIRQGIDGLGRRRAGSLSNPSETVLKRNHPQTAGVEHGLLQGLG